MKTFVKDTVRKLALGLIFLIFACFGICCMIGLLVWKETMPEAMAGTAAMALCLLAVFLVCWITSKRIGKNRVQVALALGAAFVLVCLLAGLLLAPDGELALDVKLLLPMAAAVLGGITGSMKKQRRR